MDTGGLVELYVDVVCDAVRDERSVTMIDLDFDIVRTREGEVLLLDEDEFELHRVQLGYPEAMADEARRCAAEVLDAVRAGHEPFGGVAAARWAAIAAGAGESEASGG